MILSLVIQTHNAQLPSQSINHQTNLIGYNVTNSDIYPRTFILGDSVQQREEAADKARQDAEKLAAEKAAIRPYRGNAEGQSYTGQGTAEKLYKDEIYFNCVEFAKAKTGITRTIGSGGRAGINSQEAKVGEIGVEQGRVPHAVVVVAINGDDIVINESNYIRGWISERTLHREDFLGFII